MAKKKSAMTEKKNWPSQEDSALALSEMTVMDLRKLVKKARIERWNKLDKAGMIRALVAVDEQERLRSSSVLPAPKPPIQKGPAAASRPPKVDDLGGGVNGVNAESKDPNIVLPVIHWSVPHNSGLHAEVKKRSLSGRPRKYTRSLDVAACFETYVAECRGRMNLEVIQGRLMEVPDPEPLSIVGACLALNISERTFERWLEEGSEEQKRDPMYQVAHRIRAVIVRETLRMAHSSKSGKGPVLHLGSLGYKVRQDVTSDDKPLPGGGITFISQMPLPEALPPGI